MSEVLNQDECEWVDDLRETENETLFPKWRAGLLSTIDRLVAEVERLRRRKLPDDFCARCGIGVYGHCIDAERRGCVDLGGGAACSGYVPLGRSMVAEVARLRARNAALEKVAKAAIARRDAISALDAARSTHARYCATNDLDDADRDIAALLSALNPSGPNSSGGET